MSDDDADADAGDVLLWMAPELRPSSPRW